MSTVPVEDLLPLVDRPSRYLGFEINSVHKKEEEVSLRVALAFPDLYEVGMSHLGTHVLYSGGNAVEGVQVERVFLPQTDLLEMLRQRSRPLFTLESKTPLAECGLVGFTLQSELTYTNILTILDASGIPLRATDRPEGFPLVLGGGPCAYNPEPIAEFFDLFFIGDAEIQWPAILETLRDVGDSSSRQERKQALKKITGIYDPCDFDVKYNSDLTIKEICPHGQKTGIVKALCADLSSHPPPVNPVLPFLQTIHDRVTLEVARGCTRGCRFCHAGMVYRPVRERSNKTIMEAARNSLMSTGYEDLSLVSLSIGDYSDLDGLLSELMDTYCGDRVSISLPSMRIGGLTGGVARQIRRVKKTGFTIAPEAGTQRLRMVINKHITDEEIIRTADWVFKMGWESLKLYFMVGLPTETDADLEGIVNLVNRMAESVPGRGHVTANISPFVPKSHTPFQWVAQDREPELRRKVEYLKSALRGRKIQVKWGRTDQALLEAVLARGDRRVSRAIYEAWMAGARMDGWDEHFNWEIWLEAFEKCGIDPDFYANRQRGEKETFCWDHISCGVDKQFLRKEYEKGLDGEVTEDCRQAGCWSCGVCTPEVAASIPPLREVAMPEADPGRDEGPPEPQKSCRRIRAVFKKTGFLRFLGHLEVMRTFERAARRASVPLAFTGGFSPRARINFALSMPLGVAGLAEWVDVELVESWSADRFMDAMNSQLPEGLEIESAWKAPLEGQSLNVRVRAMEYMVEFAAPVPGLGDGIDSVLESESIQIIRLKGEKKRTIELKDYLLEMRLEDQQTFCFVMSITEKGSVKPAEVVEAVLGRALSPEEAVDVTRTRLRLATLKDRAAGRPGLSRIFD